VRHVVVRQHPELWHVSHDFPPQGERLQDKAVLGGVVVGQASTPAGERRRVPAVEGTVWKRVDRDIMKRL